MTTKDRLINLLCCYLAAIAVVWISCQGKVTHAAITSSIGIQLVYDSSESGPLIVLVTDSE